MRYSDLFDPSRTPTGDLAANPILMVFVGLVGFYLLVKLLAAIIKTGGRK